MLVLSARTQQTMPMRAKGTYISTLYSSSTLLVLMLIGLRTRSTQCISMTSPFYIRICAAKISFLKQTVLTGLEIVRGIQRK